LLIIFLFISPALAAAPVADFTSTYVAGINNVPITYTFTSTATNTPTIWYWDFGDGTTTNGTVSALTHQYTGAGTFTVRLNATNGDGSDWENKTSFLTVTNPPHANPTTAGTAIVAALTLVGIMLVGSGALGLIYMFSSLGGASYGRNESTGALTIGSVLSIMLGAVLILITYAILSPLFTISGI